MSFSAFFAVNQKDARICNVKLKRSSSSLKPRDSRESVLKVLLIKKQAKVTK